ncbi:DUF1828 domain-containing protein [Bacillus paranthracis]|uniref:DUF1828 domain-containing protein n=1 Tax=Bacillus paranthracis TaxID=2026186 RepID=UPI0029C4AE79|nr:DUF1828 domain-containing protein [Bacillus paranthracis]MDX6047474.1 DUF1828 domain-containing protein [Bacillus paranthracis]
MSININLIEQSYFNWIKQNTKFTSVLNEAVELSSPFVDSLNENVKIYIEPNSHEFRITDDGYTLWSLEALGISFRKGSHREKMLHQIVDRHNIHLNDKELYILSDKDNIGRAIHILIQSVLTISDFLKTDKKNVKSLFIEEVGKYFIKNKDLYDYFPDLEIQGKSKLMHKFDYLMTTKNRQKKLVRLVNHLDQIQLERVLLSWQDTSQQRLKNYNEDLGMVALVNDSEKELPDKFTQAFNEYGIEALGFSDKEKVKHSLSFAS